MSLSAESVSLLKELEIIRSALDQSAIVAITDRAGNIVEVNEKFCEISKYSRMELLGKNHRILKSGQHPPEFFVNLWKTISSGKVWSGEIKNRAKDGTYYWVFTTIVPVMDQKGEPSRYISIRFDVSNRKQAEAQIMIQDRLASVGLLASSLAHEIGNPMGVIRGRAEYLAMQLKGNGLAEKNLGIVISQIDRVSKLIRSLLNLARGEGFAPGGITDLGHVLNDVMDLMSHEFKKHDIEVEVDLPDNGNVRVRGEGGALHQVLLNLFVNAIHAMRTATQSGRAQGHSLKVNAVLTAEKWVISVRDTGCGISPENLKNLFKPFFTTKELGVGTGLGLATSYRIVEGWGGTITAESQENVGSVFKITLPKA